MLTMYSTSGKARKERGRQAVAQQTYKLPDDFFFGAAMSGPQTEGHWRDGGKLENLGVMAASSRTCGIPGPT